jgi:hypothetical protein
MFSGLLPILLQNYFSGPARNIDSRPSAKAQCLFKLPRFEYCGPTAPHRVLQQNHPDSGHSDGGARHTRTPRFGCHPIETHSTLRPCSLEQGIDLRQESSKNEAPAGSH